MKPITFFKMSGSGNDFIIVDNREKVVKDNDLPGFITRICRRKMSVGADGFILIEPSDKADFKWRFFNSDGSQAEMCGNGARCFARFLPRVPPPTHSACPRHSPHTWSTCPHT